MWSQVPKIGDGGVSSASEEASSLQGIAVAEWLRSGAELLEASERKWIKSGSTRPTKEEAL